MSSATFDRATRRYRGAKQAAVDALSLTIGDGELTVIVGPTGCGRSTALRMLAGWEPLDGGRILIGNRDVDATDRDVAMVFQSYALYAQLSVGANMGLALKFTGVDKNTLEKRVKDAATILDLTDDLARKPRDLTADQRQRVMMGRAIVRRPRVLCMDEPLCALDEELRAATQARIALLQRRLGVTTVYAAQNQLEAMSLGDRVAVLKDGRLLQVDEPRLLYDRPSHVFVAGFIGSPAMNLVTAPVGSSGGLKIGAWAVSLPDEARARLAGSKVTLGVRPEGFRLVGAGDGFPVLVDSVQRLGRHTFLYGSLQGIARQPLTLTVQVDPGQPPKTGEVVHLSAAAHHLHYFDGASGLRLTA